MALRINFYKVKRGDDLGDPEFWNRRFEDVDLRVGKNEDALLDVGAVANQVEALALDRLNNVITPLIIQTQDRLKTIPNLFEAHSGSSVTVGIGAKSFVIDETDRETWAVADLVLVSVADDPDTWMSGRVLSFDRQVGLLHLDIDDAQGSGTFSDWTFALAGRRGKQGEIGPVGLTVRGSYSSTVTYHPNDVVTHDRSSWIAKVETLGIEPPTLPTTENASWRIFVQRGADGSDGIAISRKYVETVAVASKATFTIPGDYDPTADQMVFRNGIKLTPDDYTATNGSTVTLSAAAVLGDVFEFNVLNPVTFADVLQSDHNLSEIHSPDTALLNLGGTALGTALFKAASREAARTALDAPSSADLTGTANTLQAAINQKAPLASPSLTGNPTAPTQSSGDNSTKIATTAFVQNVASGKQNSLGFTPIRQGGGAGQGSNTVYIGWQGETGLLRYQVDSSDQGTLASTNWVLQNYALRAGVIYGVRLGAPWLRSPVSDEPGFGYVLCAWSGTDGNGEGKWRPIQVRGYDGNWYNVENIG